MHCSYELVFRFNHILIYCYVSVMYIQLFYIYVVVAYVLTNTEYLDSIFLLFFLWHPPPHVAVVQVTSTKKP